MAIVKMQLVKISANQQHFEEILTSLGDVNYFHGELATDIINADNQGKIVSEDKRFIQARQFLKTVAHVFEINDDYYDGKEYTYQQIQEMVDQVSKDYQNISDQVERFSRLKEDDLKAIKALRTYDLDTLNHLEYCHIFFGRIPNKSSARLERSDISSMIYDIVYATKGYDYLVCVSSGKEIKQTKILLSDLLFEAIDIPTYDDKRIIQAYHDQLQSIYGFVKYRGDIIDRYKYLVDFNGEYVLSGFVEYKYLNQLKAKFGDNSNIKFQECPDFISEGLTPPTLLRNNWYVKPFELLVGMYGIPNYLDFDPSALLAITYSLLFGIMFGDVGQGLVLMIGGYLFYRWKKSNLATIIARLGFFSMIFGFVYGSVFGLEEHLLPFYKMFGLQGAPINTMDPNITMTLLIGACALGAFLIIVAICTNVYLNYKRKNFGDFWFSPNGIAGLVFYGGFFLMIIENVFNHVNVMTWYFIVPIIILPLLSMLLAKPLDNFIHGRPLLFDKAKFKVDKNLTHPSIQPYTSLKKDDLIALTKLSNYDFEALNDLGYTHRFMVRITSSSAKKLEVFDVENMIFDVLNKNHQHTWILCMCGVKDYQTVLDLLRSLSLEPIELPSFDDNFTPAVFFQKLNNLINHVENGTDAQNNHQLAKSWGEYFLENIFELFEVVLSFLTNTMSFLRVAGFILSHAGMMLVVITLKDMSGSMGIVVLILGNIFVIVLEGLIVGIQTLRLEYYEMFSRYFIAGGKKFKPISFDE